jgi:hypothetical protein
MISDEELWLVKLGCLHIDGELGGISMWHQLWVTAAAISFISVLLWMSQIIGRFFSSGQSLCRYVVFWYLQMTFFQILWLTIVLSVATTSWIYVSNLNSNFHSTRNEDSVTLSLLLPAKEDDFHFPFLIWFVGLCSLHLAWCWSISQVLNAKQIKQVQPVRSALWLGVCSSCVLKVSLRLLSHIQTVAFFLLTLFFILLGMLARCLQPCLPLPLHKQVA